MTPAIREVFRDLGPRNEMALLPYLVGGFPTLDASWTELERIESAGADLVEVGVPFSDPVADGPTISDAAHRALERGATLSSILDGLCGLPPRAPRILMSYLNPLAALGRERLLERCPAAGVVGLIVPDLPAEEAQGWLAAGRRHGVSLVPLIAPTTDEARVRRIVDGCDGFVYYVSVTGTTGARDRLPLQLAPALDRVRRSIDLPLAVGFGIGSPEQVRDLAGHADGVVVGSRIVQAIDRGEDVAALVSELKQATRSRRKSCSSS